MQRVVAAASRTRLSSSPSRKSASSRLWRWARRFGLEENGGGGVAAGADGSSAGSAQRTPASLDSRCATSTKSISPIVSRIFLGVCKGRFRH